MGKGPRSGANNPRWLGGIREKTCQHCGVVYPWRGEPYSVFLKRKFCSKPCIVAGQKRLRGAEHPRYSEHARRRNRTGNSYTKWQVAVISRDLATCRHCGVKGTELHAHHVKSWKEHPELRFDVDNGLTLCYSCHWKVHTAENENPVNSVDPLTGGAEGNTEPSLGRKIIEGVTTRGRAYRRVETSCEWCGAFVSRGYGHWKKAKHSFCGYRCAGKYNAAHRKWRPMKNPQIPMAVNSSTSAGAERQDIV